MKIELGLRESDILTILQVLSRFPQVKEAIVFGSRAKGTHKPGSDVDLALRVEQGHKDVVRQISRILNDDTLLPYRFDVLDCDSITNPELLSHIQRVGIDFFKIKSSSTRLSP